MKCPICEYKETEDLIIDLRVCNWCNHIFKAVPIEEEFHELKMLDRVDNPIKGLREFLDEETEIEVFEFDFVSMMFDTFDLHPKDFYDFRINHYFNQMSLMVFLKRCGLIPVEQRNYMMGDKCKTSIVCRRPTKKEEENIGNMHTIFFGEIK